MNTWIESEINVWCLDCNIDLRDTMIADDDNPRCETCQERFEQNQWIADAEERVRVLCKKHGWDFEYKSGGFGTSSRYYELTREGGELDDDGDPCEWQTIKLRISDHGSCYCSEDVSIAMNPSGDDHSMDILERRLAAPFDAD